MRCAGWYEDRRDLQIVVLGASVALVGVIVVAALVYWGRRRGAVHLPVGQPMSGLVCYSVVCVLSLHQINSVGMAKDAISITFGTLLAVGLLPATASLMFTRHAVEVRGQATRKVP